MLRLLMRIASLRRYNIFSRRWFFWGTTTTIPLGCFNISSSRSKSRWSYEGQLILVEAVLMRVTSPCQGYPSERPQHPRQGRSYEQSQHKIRIRKISKHYPQNSLLSGHQFLRVSVQFCQETCSRMNRYIKTGWSSCRKISKYWDTKVWANSAD